MQPQLCSRCKKNIAVVFITRQENGQNVNDFASSARKILDCRRWTR